MTLKVALQHKLDGFDLDVDFETPAGLTALFGHSGSGKTSVINAVAGLVRPDAGRVEIEGAPVFDSRSSLWVPPHKRRLGYIFQEARLFTHLSVKRNLLYGRRFAPKEAPATDFDQVVEMLGLSDLLGRRTGHLSGGEKQRVAIGRALLASPRMILADEPLAALDDVRKAEILPYFERLRDESEIPILYVSHSLAEVARLATTVVTLENGQVSHQGDATTLFSDPAFRPAGVRWVGALLDAKVHTHHADGLTELDANGDRLLLPRVAQTEGTSVRVRIAAKDVILSRTRPEGLSALNILPAVVENVRAGEGPGAIATVRCKAGLVLARITRRSVAALGLETGVSCFVVVKTVSIARDDIGGRAG